MGTLNQVVLVGRVGRDPETRTTRSGKQLAKFSLATDKRFAREGKPDWHRVTAWGQSADFAARYVKTGDVVAVMGRIEYGSYRREDGTEVHTTDIVADRVARISGSRSEGAPSSARDAGPMGGEPVGDAGSGFSADDLPF